MSESCDANTSLPAACDRPAEPVNTEASPAAPSAQAAALERERWLFRQATLAGQVHPLRHLLKRYRAGERA
jgi:hypothetical protein